MRFSTLTIAASLSLLIILCAQPASAQDERDYVFTDDEGHLILRFAGTDDSALNANQRDEIVNLQLSTMVHYRLKADTAFEAEPGDSQWADAMVLHLANHVNESASSPLFSLQSVECRSSSCRLILNHDNGWRVAEHQSLMDDAQLLVETFTAGNLTSFEPVFLIAAHYQEPESPYIKLFLNRAENQ